MSPLRACYYWNELELEFCQIFEGLPEDGTPLPCRPPLPEYGQQLYEGYTRLYLYVRRSR